MSFSSIEGQDRVVAALRRALRSDRVAHAYIFAGPRGVGKMTTALEFARALVCGRGSDDACDACNPCRKVSHANHPDVHLIEPEGPGRQIKIGIVRERVIRQLGLKPYEARRKVVILDDAHAMNQNSQNCLLKTLEEPPPNSVLVLVTPRPDALFETILSRGHMIRFALLRPEVICGQLTARGLDPDSARFLSRSSGGSLGRALSMAGEGRLPEWRREAIDLVTGLTASNIVGSASAFARRIQEASDSRAASRSMAEWLLDLVVLFYRDVALRQLGVDASQVSNADRLDRIDEETGITTRGIRSILDTMEETKRLIRGNVDLDAAVLDAFSKTAAARAQRPRREPTTTEPGRAT